MQKEYTKITCPHCHTAFTVNESEYANLLNQVNKQEIEKEVHERLAVAEREKLHAVELAESKTREELQQALATKDAELLKLKAQANQKISELKTHSAEELAKIKSDNATTIAQLESQLRQAKTSEELAVTKAVTAVEKQRDELASKLQTKDAERRAAELSLKDKYENALKIKDEAIERLRDMKSKLSTKMVGETLEQHCEVQFNQLRATAFRNAYFEKDNAVSKTSGSKGDYIYRENDEHGNEIISVMFEMKNENETTATKHKNEDFFKELDKDRREKKCEYAVLVTLLEADNDLYNTGIVDVSYRYEKMYVIRPQFFIPMITVLRNAALNSLSYKAELATIREQNIDVTDFEDRIDKWKDSFSINSERATKNFNKAIKEIEDSIKKLENTRDALVQTIKNFDTANKKLDDLTIKRLTRGNPTMTEKFREIKSKD